MHQVSPSQVKTFAPEHGGCMRKWGYQKIDKIPEEPSQAAKFGQAVHRVLELYVKDGTPLPVGVVGDVARQALPVIEELDIEQAEKKINFAFREIKYRGVVDLCFNYKGIGDYKTSSNPKKYHVRDLANDPQAITYAMWWLQQDTRRNSVHLKWIYLHSKRKRFDPIVIEAELTRFEVKEQFKKLVHPHGQAITKAIATVREAEMLPANPEACGAFGGCPYASFCPKTSDEKLTSIGLAPKPALKGDSMSALKKLMAAKKAPPRPNEQNATPRSPAPKTEPKKKREPDVIAEAGEDPINAPEMPTDIERQRQASEKVLEGQALSKKAREQHERNVAEALSRGEELPDVEMPEINPKKTSQDDILRLVRNGHHAFTSKRDKATEARPFAHGRSLSALSGTVECEKHPDGSYTVWLAGQEQPGTVEAEPEPEVEIASVKVDGEEIKTGDSVVLPMGPADRDDLSELYFIRELVLRHGDEAPELYKLYKEMRGVA